MKDKFREFSEFRESSKSLKHECGSIKRSSQTLLPVPWCRCASISHVRGSIMFNNILQLNSMNLLNSVNVI